MPTGRAVFLLRRLSTGDNRLKNINFNQNSGKDPLAPIPVCFHRDYCLTKRVASYNYSNITPPQITRSFSDNIIKMSSSGGEDKEVKTPKHTNQLINEKSPYLLKHAHNPVQWYPWCQETIDKAKIENKVIFLSVGYTTSAACRQMEIETFSNKRFSKIMNKHFINIKVDRDERPDIGHIYRLFVLATSGNGEWPVVVFLTPDLHPIMGGNYFPPIRSESLPGFLSIFQILARKWKEDRQEILDASLRSTNILQSRTTLSRKISTVPGEETWDKCAHGFLEWYEPEFGGFNKDVKYPQASYFNFLFHYYARDKSDSIGKKCLEMCLHTLTKIAKGGIHDHVSGGFACYSKDKEWHIPDFEKTLYDQAQLMAVYTDAYLATKDEFFADVVRDILKYMNTDLRHEAGGYYTAEDGYSYPTFDAEDMDEGAFCVWDYKEIITLLGDKMDDSVPFLDIFCDYFNVKYEGNFRPTGYISDRQFRNKNIFIIYGSKEDTMSKFNISLEQFDKVISYCIKVLYEARQKRPRPCLNSNMLCSSNGMAIAGLAQAGQGLGEKSFVDDAIKTAIFIREHLYDPSAQTLSHVCYRAEDGSVTQADQPTRGFLEDYVYLIKGLLHLYEASLDLYWLNWACELQEKQNELFWETERGGYFGYCEDQNIILRLKPSHDGSEPCANSVACHNLLRLAAYNDKSAAPEGGEREREMAKKLFILFAYRLTEYPIYLPEMVSALMFYNDSPTQVLISGGCSDPRTLELVRVVRSRLLPGRVLAVADPAADASAGMSDRLFGRIRSAGDVPTAYVCRRFSCSLPVTDVKQLESLLDEPPAPAPAKDN